MKTYPITADDQELIKTALDTLGRAFDNHYHTVGAAVRTTGGTVYPGVNCDGIHGSCAEFIAIGAAITAGEKQFDTIVAVHQTAKNNLVPPCGNCRQMLFEYCPDIKVILNNQDGQIIKAALRDLLPLGYEEIIG